MWRWRRARESVCAQFGRECFCRDSAGIVAPPQLEAWQCKPSPYWRCTVDIVCAAILGHSPDLRDYHVSGGSAHHSRGEAQFSRRCCIQAPTSQRQASARGSSGANGDAGCALRLALLPAIEVSFSSPAGLRPPKVPADYPTGGMADAATPVEGRASTGGRCSSARPRHPLEHARGAAYFR